MWRRIRPTLVGIIHCLLFIAALTYIFLWVVMH